MNEVAAVAPQSEVTFSYLLAVLARRKWTIILVTLSCLILAVAVSLLLTKKWRADAELVLVQRPIAESMMDQSQYAPPIADTVDTQVAMIESDAMAERAVTWLQNQAIAEGRPADSVDVDVDTLERGMNVTSPPESNLIDITVDADTHDKAELWANAVCQSFVDWKTQLAQQDVDSAEATLSKQTAHALAAMKSADAQLARYKRTNNVLDVNGQDAAMINTAEAQDLAVATAKQDVASADASAATLAGQLQTADQAISSKTGVRDDTLVLAIQTQLSQAEINLANAATQVTAAYPGVLQQDKATVNDLKKRLSTAINESVNSRVSSLQSQGALLDAYKQAEVQASFAHAKLAAAEQVRRQLGAKMVAQPTTDMKYNELSQAATMAENRYTALQTDLDTARVQKSKITGDVHVVQSGTAPLLPFRPNWLVNMLLGLVLGLALSALTVLIKEQTDRRVHTIDDVRRLVAGQIIGGLPSIKKSHVRRLANGGSAPALAGPMTVCRINLQLMMHRASHELRTVQKVILCTSAAPKEGKSFAAAQLAKSIAATGVRVILVDANLRNPSQPALFNVVPESGLAEVLEGRLDLADALRPSGFENLWLMHSGTAHGNPTDLLATSALASMVSNLRRDADIVIIDAPDCTTVSDTVLLAGHSDVLLQTIGINRVDEDLMQETALAINSSGKPTAYMATFCPRTKKNRVLGSRSLYHAFAALSAPNGHGPNTTWPSLEKHIRTVEIEPARDLVYVTKPEVERD